jgi:hypothetical protein
VSFMIFTASVRKILDQPSYRLVYVSCCQRCGKFVQAVSTLNISESLVISFKESKVVPLHTMKV